LPNLVFVAGSGTTPLHSSGAPSSTLDLRRSDTQEAVDS